MSLKNTLEGQYQPGLIESKDCCALVIGGSIAGYSTISELSNNGIKNIVLFATSTLRDYACHSNKIVSSKIIDRSAESLKNALSDLRSQYKTIIIYPTVDYHLENLYAIYDSIQEYCRVPFNPKNIMDCLSKAYQYKCCEDLGIPIPKSISLDQPADLKKLSELKFPVIIKPQTRENVSSNEFRNAVIENRDELNKFNALLEKKIKEGRKLLASEVVTGGAGNIFSYVGYRNKKGEILNEWVGKKLSQWPDDFGSFATAANEFDPTVLKQGRALINGLDVMGVGESEFKYDSRDNQFKFIEVNFRSMHWGRLGHLSGVNIMLTQYMDSLGATVARERQITSKKIHLVSLENELANLKNRKGYWKIFKFNLFGGDKNVWLPLDRQDLKPFWFWFLDNLKCLMALWYKKYFSSRGK